MINKIIGTVSNEHMVSPIVRHLLGKQDFEDWRIFADKLRRDGSRQTAGHGLIILS